MSDPYYFYKFRRTNSGIVDIYKTDGLQLKSVGAFEIDSHSGGFGVVPEADLLLRKISEWDKEVSNPTPDHKNKQPKRER